jgi:hypothetical protein
MAAALVDLAAVAVYSLTMVYRRRLDRGGRHGVGEGIPRTIGTNRPKDVGYTELPARSGQSLNGR